MTEFRSIDEILAFAIEKEEGAHRFYLWIASQAKRAGMREVFEGFAAEELEHKRKIEQLLAGGNDILPMGSIPDLGLADHLQLSEPGAEMDYQDALILAMNMEKASYNLYRKLAEGAVSPEARDIFLGLAREEASHKLRFESEYDEHVYREN